MKQLRKSIRVCAILLAVMVMLPMAYGAYSLLRYGTRWRTSEYNVYLTSMKSGVRAGSIYDRSGVLLASTDPETGSRVYAADAAVRQAMVHAVGDTRGTVKNAVESFMAEYLYGANMTFWQRFRQSAQGGLRGDDVTLTLDSALSAYIASVFPAGKNGAAVVMNYKTGELYALCSFPSFDPSAGGSVTVNQALNRATRWLSATGSTFKIVTLTSALQNLPDVENRAFQCTGGVTFGEHQRSVSDYGGSVHGNLSLQTAFTQSCNSTFAIIASELGDKNLRKTAEAYGIGDDFTFRDLVVENSALSASDSPLLGADLAWTGVGQHQLSLTPLHLCMIASAVANDGVMMEPRLLLRAVSPEGSERAAFEPLVYRNAISPALAATVKEYMRAVVASGTGRSAAVTGLSVCGKTGTAEIDTQTEDNAWFVGFIDSAEYPIAVCVAVQNAGTGGSVAAPVAQKIFRYITGK